MKVNTKKNGKQSMWRKTLNCISIIACMLAASTMQISAQNSNEAVIKLRTKAPVGTALRIYMQPYNEATVEGLEAGEFLGEYKVTEATDEISIKGNLTEFECYGNQLTELTIESAPELYILKCNNNALTKLDVSKLPELAVLECHENQLTALDVAKNPKLETLNASSNKLQSLTLGTENTLLNRIECGNNMLSTLDVANCPAITDLYAENNKLTTIDLSKNTKLSWIKLYGNDIKGDNMDKFAANIPNAANIPGMLYIVDTRSDNELNECMVKHVNAFKDKGWVTCDYAGGVNNGSMIGTFYYGKDYVPTTSDRSIKIRTAKNVGEQITLDISTGESDVVITGVKEPVSSGKSTYTLTATDIEIKGDVTKLICSDNQLTELSLTNPELIKELDCSNNDITTLNLTGSTALTTLNCQNNDIKELNLSGCTSLLRVNCYLNNLKAQKMTDMMNSLYDGVENEPILFVIDTKADTPDRNICLTSDVAIATGKSWEVKDNINGGFYGMGQAYAGSDPIYYTVTIENAQHGNVTVTDDIDLSKVLNGTELHFKATAESGYELDKLTANDVDITKEMSVEVNAAMTIKATFKEQKLPENYIRISRATKDHVSVGMTLKDPEATPVVKGGTITAWNGSNLIFNMTEDVTTIYGDIVKLQALFAQLTLLDISHCPTITELNCGLNDIENLDLSNNANLTSLSCEMNLLKTLDVSACKNLSYLNCYGMQIKGTDMTNLVNSLPARNGMASGRLIVIDTTLDSEENVCTKTDVDIAKAKNWNVFDLRGGVENMIQYEGSNASVDSAVNTAAYYDTATNRLILSEESEYEVYGINGLLVDKNTGNTIDFSGLQNGIYIVRYSGNVAKIVKR